MYNTRLIALMVAGLMMVACGGPVMPEDGQDTPDSDGAVVADSQPIVPDSGTEEDAAPVVADSGPEAAVEADVAPDSETDAAVVPDATPEAATDANPEEDAADAAPTPDASADAAPDAPPADTRPDVVCTERDVPPFGVMPTEYCTTSGYSDRFMNCVPVAYFADDPDNCGSCGVRCPEAPAGMFRACFHRTCIVR